MTFDNDYLNQLKESSVNLDLQVPGNVSEAVADKVILASQRSNFDFPQSIIYTTSINKTNYSNVTPLSRVRACGWQLELLIVTTKNTNEELILAVIKKSNESCRKTSSKDRRNGNNSIRFRKIRR